MFGLKPSPPILGAVVNHHLDSYDQTYPRTVKALRDLYVDDLATSVNNEEENFQIYKESKAIMLEGSFDLRKWNSNCKQFLQHIRNEDQKHDIELNLNDKVQVLGMSWDVHSDHFLTFVN